MVFSYRFCCGVPLQLPGPLCLPPAIGSIVMTYAVRNPAQGNEGRVSKGMYSEPTKVRDLGVDGRQLEARAGLGPVSLQAIGLPNGLDGHPRILRGRVVIGGDGPKGVAGCDGAGGGQLLGIGTCTGIEGASGNGHEDHGPPTSASGIRVFVPPEENKGRPVLSQRHKARSCGSVLCWQSSGTNPPTWASAEARLSRSLLFLVCRDEVYTKGSPTGDSRPVLQGFAYHGRALSVGDKPLGRFALHPAEFAGDRRQKPFWALAAPT